MSRRRFTIYCRQIEALTPLLAASGPSGSSPEINSRKGSIVIQQLNCTAAENGAYCVQSSTLISVIGCVKWERISQPRTQFKVDDCTCGNSPGGTADNDVRLMSRIASGWIMTKRGANCQHWPLWLLLPSLTYHVITLVRSTQSGVIFCVGLSRKSVFLIHLMNQI